MATVDVLVPQMGEGLQEVLVVEFLKKPGERVRRDEPFYAMETDKALLEVESPEDGVLVEWLAREGDTLAIGAPVCRIDVSALSAEPVSASTPSSDVRSFSPRTRAYAKEKGISEAGLAQIPISGAKLMPEDVDSFLAIANEAPSAPYKERPLSAQDKTFLFRLKRSAAQTIPAVAKRTVPWDGIRLMADRSKAGGDSSAAPSAFLCLAYAIALAARKHIKFRSTLIGEDSVREHDHVNLGIAVAVPTGELTLAKVEAADALPFPEFVRASKASIAAARRGDDQADESIQLVLTYMGPYEITDGIPVLVAPAVGVLFIGSTFQQEGKSVVNLVLSFDHRIVHGVEAAEFLRSIAGNVAKIESLLA